MILRYFEIFVVFLSLGAVPHLFQFSERFVSSDHVILTRRIYGKTDCKRRRFGTREIPIRS